MEKMRESRSSASSMSVVSRPRKLRERAGDGADVELTALSLEDLLRHTRRQLLEYARRVGLTGIHRLTKAALATRVRQELARRADVQEPADVSRKFDLGFTSAEAAGQEDIPWGYGQDRVTAMAVDPERLYVYWELTDEALEHARAGLGPGGRDAWRRRGRRCHARSAGCAELRAGSNGRATSCTEHGDLHNESWFQMG